MIGTTVITDAATRITRQQISQWLRPRRRPINRRSSARSAPASANGPILADRARTQRERSTDTSSPAGLIPASTGGQHLRRGVGRGVQQEAEAWLAGNRQHAPRDYGAICPPDLVDVGLDWQRRLTNAGWAGVHWPTEHGGRRLTPEHNGVWLLECARAGVPAVFNRVGLVLTGGAILRYGTPQQQRCHLRSTLATEHVWCQLFSEPGAGSDLGSLATRAELGGDRYMVNGQKVWCSGGRTATGES
ncbi:MAG: acyl-CoA dehydrogenase family protein [Ilumatobacteraceae bacterium]